jgi:hypothetical protein
MNDNTDDDLGSIFDAFFNTNGALNQIAALNVDLTDDPTDIRHHLDEARHAVETNTPLCGASALNGRSTKTQLARLDALIFAAAEAEHPVSLRGVFYRVSSLGGVAKTEAGYRKVGRELLKLRRSGDIPYSWIADGTRFVLHARRFDSVKDALRTTAAMYRRQLWSTSHVAVEVFAEKDAISGVVHPVCDEWDVPLAVVRGYTSETFAHSVAESLDRDRVNLMLNLGDHDPSGVGAWDDIVTKVRNFAPDCEIEAVRLAVTPEQIDTYDLPTRPTKRSDTRAKGWVGDSVEVDALPANVLRDLLGATFEGLVDADHLAAMKAAEESERDIIERMAVRS